MPSTLLDVSQWNNLKSAPLLQELSLLCLLLAQLMSCCTELVLPLDCSDVHNKNPTWPSGVYTIYPIGATSAVQVNVYTELILWKKFMSCRILHKGLLCTCRCTATWTLWKDSGLWVLFLFLFLFMFFFHSYSSPIRSQLCMINIIINGMLQMTHCFIFSWKIYKNICFASKFLKSVSDLLSMA